jgi:hypothetical protein
MTTLEAHAKNRMGFRTSPNVSKNESGSPQSEVAQPGGSAEGKASEHSQQSLAETAVFSTGE